MNDSLDLLDLAARAAEAAGKYIRSVGRYEGSVGGTANPPHVPTSPLTDKGHHDWATEVDRQAESLIGEILRAGAPGSRIVGEESSPGLQQEGLGLVVGPLAGTPKLLPRHP